MAQPRIPRYGIWKDEETHGFTIQFEKVRTFRKTGPVMNQDVLPAPSTTSTTPTDPTEPPMNQDMGLTPPPETTSPVAKARSDINETTKANDGVKKPNGKPRSKSPPNRSPNVSPPVPEFGAWDKSQNFTDVFNQIQRGSNVDCNPDPPRRPTKKPKSRNKGSFCKWLCGCCFL